VTRYAEGTTVAPEKSEMEIKALLRKHGAEQVLSGTDEKSGRVMIAFVMKGRQIRVKVTLPTVDDEQFMKRWRWDRSARVKAREAEVRRLWRALLLTIKARFEVVESGIETFESAWLAHIVMPNGSTVADVAIPALEAMYLTKRMPDMFLGVNQLPSGPPR
jgi:hypothetical protein